MSMRLSSVVVASWAAATLVSLPALAGITIPTVPVGNPGNAADASSSGGAFGSVAYTYEIGRTEVTIGQYAAFLNAVAASDPNGLYNPQMSGELSGITRAGAPGSYSYTVNTGRENFPVNYVSFWDSVRFANWLHNGQPTGPQSAQTTEDGAYTLSSGAIASNSVTRNAGWQWAVPDANEWHKAAYYQPASEGGEPDSYWPYPTSTDWVLPSQAAFGYWAPTLIAPVGSYAPNFVGTYDMAGNLHEWTDTQAEGQFRVARGGWFSESVFPWMNSSANYISGPGGESVTQGFRVVAVPGPGALVLAGIGGLAVARRRR